MRVLNTGATGYIGAAVTEALEEAGHTVVGLARAEGRGVETVGGDLTDPASLRQAAAQVDAVVHTGFTSGDDAGAVDRAAVGALTDALAGTARPLVYTSGVWVVGDTGGAVRDESAALDPTPLMAWRPAVERDVLDAAARSVRTVVIRPSVVYGHGGGLVGMLVDSAKQDGVARYPGDGANHWALVHVRDLARLYVLALERAPAGTLLHGDGDQAVRLRDLAAAASLAAGGPGRAEGLPAATAREELGLLADALMLDQRTTGARARSLLGWSPRERPALDELLGAQRAAA